MVTITVMPPAETLVPPTDEELARLRDIVCGLRPELDLRRDPDLRHLDHDREFRLAFRAVGMMGRRSGVDHGKAVSYWADYARNLLQDCGVRAEMPGSVVMAAALAHGDVPHARNALGLTWANSGTRAGDAWRGVMVRGALRRPSAEQVSNWSTGGPPRAGGPAPSPSEHYEPSMERLNALRHVPGERDIYR